ncbi:DEAD/DEAH box helicase [Allobranchiibius sp. CTAmp26]|uniref:DEAD/DEAH box helicase n=1 Tax=Allobranchiibius sp. CTAmp26 TaxID=2815214 RepID=UPI001AA1ABC3|nr:DEAD/DEAH box helicase [Allobranchiibius sp. CTAmp26]MBO1753741.1 DEAD/DEAH box helicase [Allobranchiibius sp. CTAmp26]
MAPHQSLGPHTDGAIITSSTFRPDVASALPSLTGVGTGRLLHVRTEPARPAYSAPWPTWVHAPVRAAVEGTGVRELWTHQRRVADLAHEGVDVGICTGTASGKSLAYLLPVLSALSEGVSAPTGRGATAIYLAPTKALGADQEARIASYAIPGIRAATLDGDTPTDERRWIREHAHLVLTNPDLLHHTLLPQHERWASFLRRLRYVVVDESHVYRGVFGAHVALILRRLQRIAARYSASPTFVLASATSAAPSEQLGRLVGRPVQVVDEDGSPHGATTYALWEPGSAPSDPTGERRRSAVAESADLMTALVRQRVQTLTFARSRVGVEVVAEMTRAALGSDGSSVAAYRGGYLPEERRELERALRSGELRGLAATNALELGIDISGLDAVVMAGWPGTVASFRQQAGRAGRGAAPSLVVLVAADDPLDTFVTHHPEAIFDRPVEQAVCDPANPYVLAPHLAAAAAELPVTVADAAYFGDDMVSLLAALVARGVLRRRPRGWFWAREDRPADHFSLRGSGEDVVRIVETRTARVLGTVDGARSHTTVHTGAVYTHQGAPFVVTALDLDDGSAHVVPGDPGWSTMARSVSSFDIVSSDRHEVWGDCELHFGTIRVRSQVTSFLRRLPSGEVLGEHPLDLPERELVTRGVWWTMPEPVALATGLDPADLPGALHAAEHASIGMLPLVAQSDRWDIGGVSTALHPDTGVPTVVVYDGHPGGAGFTERAYAAARVWLAATRLAIAECSCSHGCPSCVQSPKCGNGNEPLDKPGAVLLLDRLLRDAPGGREG